MPCFYSRCVESFGLSINPLSECPLKMNVPKDTGQKTDKKKFDKKKFWNQKYNKKLRVQQWEEKRQKYVMRKYHKELKKINKTPNSTFNKTPSEEEIEVSVKTPPQRLSTFKSAQLELQRRKEEKQKQREERLRKQKEVQEAMERYKKKKAEKFRKLSKKTKRGQPVMKERLHLLLEEIEQKIANES